MLHAACGQLAHWQSEAATADFLLSVNVSPIELAQPGFVAGVRDVLRGSGVDPRGLMLEITESCLVESEGAAVVLHELRELGIRIAIDDFGTGYSSLGMLRALPLDVLKIDRSFVLGLSSSDTDRAFLRAIRELASTLRLAVIVEGVETPDQAQCARELSCELAQGYLYARPLSASALDSMLAGRAAQVPAQVPAEVPAQVGGERDVTSVT